MRVAPVFRPVIGVLLAAIVVLGTFLVIARSGVGADPKTPRDQKSSVSSSDTGTSSGNGAQRRSAATAGSTDSAGGASASADTLSAPADQTSSPAPNPTSTTPTPPPTPTITANVSGSSTNGWYTGRVSLTWDISDHHAFTNFDPDCDVNPPSTGDLAATQFTCTGTLKAGGTVKGVTTIQIDRTPPTVTCPDPPPVYGVGSPDGVVLTAAVTDATSGAPPTASAKVTTTVAAPDLQVDVTATDAAGNSFTKACHYSVTPDTTPPTATVVSVTGPMGNNGWYVGDVTVVFAIGDDLPNSVLGKGCDPPTVVATDTTGTDVTCTATSGGGTATASTTVKRDATPPVITCPTAPQVIQGNSITVQATVADATSGAATPTASAVGSEYPLGQHTVTITAQDNAGNTGQSDCAYVVVPDPAAPVVTPVVVGPTASDPSPFTTAVQSSSTSVPAWYTGDVTVRFTIEAASPLITSSGCGPVTITEDTPGVTVSCTATSSGGTTTNSVTIARDATAPSVTCQAPPTFVNGTQGNTVTATFADATSGVAADTESLAADTMQIGAHSLAMSVQDLAGNVTDAQCGYTVIPDTTPPVIQVSYSQLPSPSGWYTTAVTVTFAVYEPDSPIISTSGCAPQTLDQDSVGTTLDCEATSFGGTAHQSPLIKVDITAPTVTCQAVDFVQGAPGRVSATTKDDTSGVSATWVYATADTNTLGVGSVALTSTDKAGNSATVDCQYDVLAAATVKAANLSKSGQDMVPPVLIASFVVLMGGGALALAVRRRAATGRHGT